MKILRMLRPSLAAAVLLCSGLAAAQDDVLGALEQEQQDVHGDITGDIGDDSSTNFIPRQNCQFYNNNPFQCDRTPGCQYSRIYSQCLAVGPGPGPGPNRCSYYNGNQYQCQQNGCQYDFRSGACFGGGPGPGPQPDRCRYYNGNQYQCQQNGCQYDYRSGACFGGGPGPGPGRGYVCTAMDRGFEEHRGGHQGVGRTEYAAQQQAINSCRRYHDECRIASCQIQ